MKHLNVNVGLYARALIVMYLFCMSVYFCVFLMSDEDLQTGLSKDYAIYRDEATGCDYISTRYGITPRLDQGGNIVCNEVTK